MCHNTTPGRRRRHHGMRRERTGGWDGDAPDAAYDAALARRGGRRTAGSRPRDGLALALLHVSIRRSSGARRGGGQVPERSCLRRNRATRDGQVTRSPWREGGSLPRLDDLLPLLHATPLPAARHAVDWRTRRVLSETHHRSEHHHQAVSAPFRLYGSWCTGCPCPSPMRAGWPYPPCTAYRAMGLVPTWAAAVDALARLRPHCRPTTA